MRRRDLAPDSLSDAPASNRPLPTVVPRSPSACFTREEARRARSPCPPSSRMEKRPWKRPPHSSGLECSGNPGHLSTDVCYPRFHFQRRVPRRLGSLRTASHAIRELSVSRRELASAGRQSVAERFVSAGIHRRTSDASSPTPSPPARCAEVLGLRAPGGTRCPPVSARWVTRGDRGSRPVRPRPPLPRRVNDVASCRPKAPFPSLSSVPRRTSRRGRPV